MLVKGSLCGVLLLARRLFLLAAVRVGIPPLQHRRAYFPQQTPHQEVQSKIWWRQRVGWAPCRCSLPAASSLRLGWVTTSVRRLAFMFCFCFFAENDLSPPFTCETRLLSAAAHPPKSGILKPSGVPSEGFQNYKKFMTVSLISIIWFLFG